MDKPLLILTLSISFAFLVSTKIAEASSMQVAADSNFSNQITEFSAGQTIYVQVSANNDGSSKHQLNIKDNAYNQIAAYNLSKNGNEFSANFSAPNNEGYYSLEAQIESSGSKSTSVKTIKVGKPQNANVSVNLQTKVEGQNIAVSRNTNQSVVAKSSPIPTLNSSQSPIPDSSPQIADYTDYTFDQSENGTNILINIGQFFQRIWMTIWPFR